MVHVDTDQPLTQWDILKEFQREVASVVRIEHLSNYSINLLSSIVPSMHELQEWQAEHLVRRSLFEIAESLPNKSQSESFLRPGISDRELIEVLEYASKEQLLRLSSDITRASEGSPKLQSFLNDKFDNLLFYAGSDEKCVILDQVVTNCKGNNRATLAALILRSSESLEELEALTARHSKLIESDSRLLEFKAHAICRRYLSDLELPKAPSNDANAEEIESYRKDLETCLRDIIKFCLSNATIAKSRPASDLVETALSDLRDIAFECSMSDGDQKLILERLRTNGAIIELELMHGVNISYGTGVPRSFLDLLFEVNIARWNLEEVNELKSVLSAIPQNHLLLSPQLREIQRVDYLGDRILGARYRADGVIKLASLTFNHEGMQDAFEGVSSLSIVLAHEVGHGLQIGEGPAGVVFPEKGQPTFGIGEARYDFDEYLKLSGWRVISRDRYTKEEASQQIKIDGKEYALESEVEFEGKKVYLTFDEEDNLLLAYNANATFSLRDYARTNPWEDFAEAFAEYIFLPERLIRLSPEKFQYFELELRRYHDNQILRGMLKDALHR